MAEQVDHPAHYNQGAIETIDVWDSMGIGEEGCLSNVIKYAMRYRFKHEDPERQLLDLKKAAWYLNRIIEKRSAPPSSPMVESPTRAIASEYQKAEVRQIRFNFYAKKCPGTVVSIYDGGMRDALLFLRPCFTSDPRMIEQIDGILESLTV